MSEATKDTAREIGDAIVTGKVDEHLGFIISCINSRREQIQLQQKAMLRVGDRVIFNDQSKKFTGDVGVVERKMQKNIEVRLDRSNEWGEPIVVRTPASLVTLVRSTDEVTYTGADGKRYGKDGEVTS